MCRCVQVQDAYYAARQDGQAGRYAEAQEKMLKVCAIEPWDSRILTDVAELTLALGEVDEAVSSPHLARMHLPFRLLAMCFLYITGVLPLHDLHIIFLLQLWD